MTGDTSDYHIAQPPSWRRFAPGLSTMVILVGVVVLIAVITNMIGSIVLDRIVIQMLINLILVLGLQMFMGNSDILWFPHVGFMGIGAYASVIFSMAPLQKMISLPDLYPFLASFQLDFLSALIAGALVAAVIAGIIGVPLMRLSDFPAVIAGFALLVVIHVILSHWTALTNGPQTLFGVERATFIGQSAAWACIAIVLAYLFKESKVGLQLRASRDDLVSAASVGVNITQVRWIAFVLSAFMAGIAGGLYAHFITSFTSNAFFLAETFVILAMLVIGGPWTVTGAVAGTLIVSTAYQALRWTENTLNAQEILPFNVVGLTEILLAIAMILVLIMRPAGLIERNEVRVASIGRLYPRRRRADRDRAGIEGQPPP